jgi:hypothetical protein
MVWSHHNIDNGSILFSDLSHYTETVEFWSSRSFLCWAKNLSKHNEFFKLQLVTSKEVKKKEKAELPPVSVMVIESIKALKEPPRKGSTLRAIKETISLNWPVKK